MRVTILQGCDTILEETENNAPNEWNEEEVMEALRIIAMQLDQGLSVDEIVEELVKDGLEEEQARAVVESVAKELDRLWSEEEQIVNVVANRLFEGENPEDIVKEFVAAGVEEHESRDFINNIKSEIDRIQEMEKKIETATLAGIESGLNADAIIAGLVKEDGFEAETIAPIVNDIIKETTQTQ